MLKALFNHVVMNSTGTATNVSTFTVTNGLAQITGRVLVAATSTPITTGVLVVATTATIASATPPPITGSAGGSCSPCYYQGASDASGSYTLSVRSSTSTAYNLYGWYTTFSGTTPSTVKKSYSVAVNTAGAPVAQNLSW